MSNEEKKKKHKHPHTDMHPNITCGVRNCGYPIKTNVVERVKHRNNFTCYYHGMIEAGKTHLSGIPIKDLLHARKRVS